MRLSALVKQAEPAQRHDPRRARTLRSTGPTSSASSREHPHVDVAVHGEGEQTFAELLAALRGHVGDGPPDLAPLDDVAGLSYRGRKRRRHHRLSAIASPTSNAIPSPILTGLFDGFIPAGPLGGVALETNRGCPYGCTFCDWGSATLSRIRKFDLDRIFAELEWCATQPGPDGRHRRRQLRHLRARRRDRREDRRAQGHLRLSEEHREQLRQEHGEAPLEDHRDLHRGRHRGRRQDVDAELRRRARSRSSAARTSRSRSTTSWRSSSVAIACRCRST